MIFSNATCYKKIFSNVYLHHYKWKLLIIRENIYEDFLRKGKAQARNYLVLGQLLCKIYLFSPKKLVGGCCIKHSCGNSQKTIDISPLN